MLTFRKKIFFSDLALFFIFILFLFPLFDFNLTFLFFCSFILLLYSIISWMIIYRLSSPIQKVLDAILPYQEGCVEFLPRIFVNQEIDTDEFSKLALTLNSLGEKIQNQMTHLIEQRKQTEEILHSLGEGIIALNIKAKITFSNQTACELLGVAYNQIIGQPLDAIHSKSDLLLKKCHELVLQVLQTSESVTETLSLNLDKNLRLCIIAMPRGKQQGVILVIQDKTSDYKVVEMGKDFIANASHELKTPITIIQGFAETLQNIPHLTPKMFKEITGKIVLTCERLNHLVKSLLVLADMENISENRFCDIDLIPLLENCVHMASATYSKSSISLNTQLPHCYISADRDLLDLAIMNLLENSVKYSNSSPQIEVVLEKEASHVHLQIIDKGIGIPEEDLSSVFTRFYTVDKARSKKLGGAGLGLSIVKTIVEKHKGTLKVTSVLGEGSTFKMSFLNKQLSKSVCL